MKRLTLTAIALAVVAVACGKAVDTSGINTTFPPITTTPIVTTAPIVSATTQRPEPFDPTERLLVVRREGGLLPPEFLLSPLPLYTLYADGRLVYEGPQPPAFPRPLLPSVMQIEIGDEGLTAVMAAIVEAGLPAIAELYNTDAINQVADGPNTDVAYFDDNGEHFFSVYALGIADQKDPQVLKLRDLVVLLDRLASTSPDARRLPVERLQVIVSSQTVDADNPITVIVPWPLSVTPQAMQERDFGLRCAVVAVADEPSALQTFQNAHQLTFFEFEGIPYRLTVRPLLIFETGCGPLRR